MSSEPATEPRLPRVAVDWTACRGHGVCADLLPERIVLDEWGYPVVDPDPVPARAGRRARRAVSECPALALKLLS
jgi:ferredoxin